jgi:signal transduction histidine kinase
MVRADETPAEAPLGSYALARRPAWQRFGVAILLTVFVVATRRSLDPWLGHQHNRHLVFLPTVMLAAWVAGLGPGVVSTLLFTAALGLLWGDHPDGHALTLPGPDLVLFLMLGVAICAVIDSLQKARARAEDARRSRERLLGIVAHDLRNPLTAIRTVAAGLGRANPELAPRLERIDRAVSRADDLIRDLVDMTRIEHGELVVSPRVELVGSMLEETVELFSPPARAQGITLAAEGSATSAAVACDRGRIMQVLSNLVGNALKFTPSGGQVRIGYEERDNVARFEVADSGPGIRAEDRERVFDPYWRGDSRGTGLGLFIARTIVEAHGGRLAVDSPPGEGARFWFTLPRVSAPAAISGRAGG